MYILALALILHTVILEFFHIYIMSFTEALNAAQGAVFKVVALLMDILSHLRNSGTGQYNFCKY